MSCPEFEKNGLLLISGELNKNEAREYRNHLKECTLCVAEIKEFRKIFEYSRNLEEFLPGPEVRESILNHSRRRPVKAKLLNRIENWWQERIKNQLWVLGVSTVATAAVLVILLLKPFSNMERLNGENALAWNDDFLMESLYLNEDIDNIHNFSNLAIIDEQSDDSIEDLSTMTDEFSTIRNGIEDLLQEIKVF